MSCFSHRYDAYFPEILQVQRAFAAHDSPPLPPQFPLHRRRDIDRSQGLVENVAGELFQIRHERVAPGSPFKSSALLDSARSPAAGLAKAPPRSPRPCTPSLRASPAKPRRYAAPARRSHAAAPDESPALFQI